MLKGGKQAQIWLVRSWTSRKVGEQRGGMRVIMKNERGERSSQMLCDQQNDSAASQNHMPFSTRDAALNRPQPHG